MIAPGKIKEKLTLKKTNFSQRKNPENSGMNEIAKRNSFLIYVIW